MILLVEPNTQQFVLLFSLIATKRLSTVQTCQEDMSAAASREVPMTKQIIDCLSALGEVQNCVFALPGNVLVPMSNTFYHYYFQMFPTI